MEKLLLIDDEADVQYSFRRIFDASDIELHTASSGEEGIRLISVLKPDLVLSDIRMAGLNGLETLRRIRQLDPQLPVILMTAYGTTQTAIEAMKLGAYDYLLKPFDVPRLKQLVANALKAARDTRQTVAMRPQLEQQDYELGVIGRSAPMQEVFKLIGQLAASDATALITGESGTGKELVARSIFQNSRRAKEPFMAINCAAIPENLLESELFGHEKGAFTGATAQRPGRFEQCHRGTLFLDEIGDMPPATQTKILRVLQSGTFERVGGNTTLEVDVRIIAATNKPLEEAVARKEFREDLFYRLNVVRVHMPPLRERQGDIRLLVDFFLRKIGGAGAGSKSIGEKTLAVLEAYHWPGNVRELENVLRRAVVVVKGSAILESDLPPEILQSVQASRTPHTAPASTASALQASTTQNSSTPLAPAASVASVEAATSTALASNLDPAITGDIRPLVLQLFRWARLQSGIKVLPAVERELVIEALKETQGNQVRAAKLLGITRATLRKRVDKFGIRRELSVS
ncbi:MAG: sigma-54 dependent transcriptional regulator [Verrucomicrobia bacterium]|nr:sigma-54 dependent transcriptional regulator [Verrucomicrobiota bacterium]